jgi:hypothetical protein
MIEIERPEPTEGGWTVSVHGVTRAEAEQLDVLLEALVKYVERNAEYNDNWRRMGWRGLLVRVRERAERLWDSLWNHPSPHTNLAESEKAALERKLDDAIDGINFLGFLVRAVRANNRDGSWWEGM